MSFNAVGAKARCGSASGCACGSEQAQPILIDRRDFVMRAAAAMAAVALAGCGSDGATSPSSVTSTTLQLADYPALSSVGGVATVSVSGVPLAIVRTSSTTFAVFSRICPHQGSTINVTSTGFLCPNHGAAFNKSGQWVGGQPTSNLASYPVTYDATAGTLTVGG